MKPLLLILCICTLHSSFLLANSQVDSTPYLPADTTFYCTSGLECIFDTTAFKSATLVFYSGSFPFLSTYFSSGNEARWFVTEGYGFNVRWTIKHDGSDSVFREGRIRFINAAKVAIYQPDGVKLDSDLVHFTWSHDTVATSYALHIFSAATPPWDTTVVVGDTFANVQVPRGVNLTWEVSAKCDNDYSSDRSSRNGFIVTGDVNIVDDTHPGVVQVVPLPSSNVCDVIAPSSIDFNSIRLQSVEGVVIDASKIVQPRSDEKSFRIRTEALTSGLYNCRFRCGLQWFSCSLIVAH